MQPASRACSTYAIFQLAFWYQICSWASQCDIQCQRDPCAFVVGPGTTLEQYIFEHASHTFCTCTMSANLIGSVHHILCPHQSGGEHEALQKALEQAVPGGE
jgi:hypothetical protein